MRFIETSSCQLGPDFFFDIMLMLQERNVSQYLQMYSQIYPRYMPLEWGPGFQEFQDTVNMLFYNMPYFIGIPQAILNLIVLYTVILITKHPYLGELK